MRDVWPRGGGGGRRHECWGQGNVGHDPHSLMYVVQGPYRHAVRQHAKVIIEMPSPCIQTPRQMRK